MGRLVVREDLVNAKDHVCKQKRAFDRIPLAAADAPSSEEYGACNGNAYQRCIDVTDFRKSSDPPKKVDGA